MAYQDSTACKLLATQCVICGRPLVDARSVELGVGPECRKGVDGGIDDGTRTVVNKLLFKASLAASSGAIEDVLKAADEIDQLGLNEVAGKVRRRFVKAVQRDPDIIVEVEDGQLKVATPFRRGDKQAFIDAWRNIPGRRYHSNRNWVPLAQKRALWALLQRFFPGKYGRGPKGVFRVPVAEEPKTAKERSFAGLTPWEQAYTVLHSTGKLMDVPSIIASVIESLCNAGAKPEYARVKEGITKVLRQKAKAGLLVSEEFRAGRWYGVPGAEKPKPKTVEAEPVIERDEPATASVVDPESLPKGQLELNFS